jgi:hypothetical protein
MKTSISKYLYPWPMQNPAVLTILTDTLSHPY